MVRCGSTELAVTALPPSRRADGFCLARPSFEPDARETPPETGNYVGTPTRRSFFSAASGMPRTLPRASRSPNRSDSDVLTAVKRKGLERDRRTEQSADAKGRFTMGCKIIVLSGGKGGVGRSTLSRNFLVAGGLAGISAVGFDLDRQATFQKWHLRRVKTREEAPACPATDVRLAHVSDWRSIVSTAAEFDMAIIDTAPGIEENMASMLSLCQAATFVVVPCGVSHDDIESVVPWMTTLLQNKVKAAFVLNKANRRTKSFATARSTLHRYGPLCPVEIPLLEDIHGSAAEGLAAMDFENARGGEPIESVWQFVRREAGL